MDKIDEIATDFIKMCRSQDRSAMLMLLSRTNNEWHVSAKVVCSPYESVGFAAAAVQRAVRDMSEKLNIPQEEALEITMDAILDRIKAGDVSHGGK